MFCREAELERLRLLAADKKGKNKGKPAAAPPPKVVAPKSPRDGARPSSGKSVKSNKSGGERAETPRSESGREEDKDPATKAKEKLQQRIDM